MERKIKNIVRALLVLIAILLTPFSFLQWSFLFFVIFIFLWWLITPLTFKELFEFIKDQL